MQRTTPCTTPGLDRRGTTASAKPTPYLTVPSPSSVSKVPFESEPKMSFGCAPFDLGLRLITTFAQFLNPLRGPCAID